MKGQQKTPVNKIIAVVQARMGSTRLPSKVLMDIGGRPMLWHVVTRTRRAETLTHVVVATTTAVEDDIIASFCAQSGIFYYRGSESDVLDRYYRAAEIWGAEVIVRITADCPLIDPAVIDRVVSCFLSGEFDYVSNIDPPTFPDGLDTEVFSFAALEGAWKEARLPSEREHVTPYLRNHPERFRTANITHREDLSGLRWTVDEEADLNFVRGIFAKFDSGAFSMEEVCKALRRWPVINGIKMDFQRNEGYARSLREDKLLCD